MSRNEIGSYLDLAVETVSRVFTRCQASGPLEAEGKEIRILDSIHLCALGRKHGRLTRLEPGMIFDELSIKKLIRPVPDFPKPGVVFRDITPLLQSPKALRMVADSLIQRYVETDFSHVGALDARGFIIGSIIAYELNKPLILFRKRGKLPADVLAASYSTEYGEAFLEVHTDSLCEGDSVLLLDDLIATGGTLVAAAQLVRRMGAQIHEAAAIIDLPELGGSRKLQDMGIPTFTLTGFELNER